MGRVGELSRPDRERERRVDMACGLSASGSDVSRVECDLVRAVELMDGLVWF